MPNNTSLIKDGKVVNNLWQIVNEDHSDLSQDHIILPYSLWLANQDELNQRAIEGKIGLLLEGDHNLQEHNKGIASFALIVIRFPGFMDGRGFSVGRLLRERYGFTGELRATGGVIRDQLCYLQRCGFTSFDLDAEINIEAALESLSDFSEGYQVSVDLPTPLFRRRA
jgi:uncharacterized protein (DUF934 family)